MRHTLVGITMPGRVSHHTLRRTIAVTREMITTARKTAVAAAGGPHPSVLPRIEWIGIGLAPHTAILRTIGISGVTMTGNRVGTSAIGTKTNGRFTMSAPSDVDSAGELPTLISPLPRPQIKTQWRWSLLLADSRRGCEQRIPAAPMTLLCSWGVSTTSHTGMHF